MILCCLCKVLSKRLFKIIEDNVGVVNTNKTVLTLSCIMLKMAKHNLKILRHEHSKIINFTMSKFIKRSLWIRTTRQILIRSDFNNDLITTLLKELRNCNRKLFSCPPQNRWKRNHEFTPLFNKIIGTFTHQTKYLHVRKLILLLMTNIYLNFFETHTDQNILKWFYSVWKERLANFKSSSCNKLSPQCVCYWYNLLLWMFFIPCDNWSTWFFLKVYRCSVVFLTTKLLLSLTQVLWKKSIFYMLSP